MKLKMKQQHHKARSIARTAKTSVYTFLPFYLLVLIITELQQYIVLSLYSIVSVDCIAFDHTVFIILYSAIFAASMSINVQFSSVQ